MSRRLLAFNSGDRQAARFDTLASELYGEAAGRFRKARSLPASWRLFMVVEDDRPLARAAAISNPLLKYRDSVPGIVGCFEAVHDVDAARLVLEAVEHCLRDEMRATVAIGPMDGSTWERYRVALPGSVGGPFLLDNVNPPYYQELFEACGYSGIADYISTRFAPTPATFSRLERAQRIFDGCGIKLHEFDTAAPVSEIRDLYQISRESFARNFLYTPISMEAFKEKYTPVLPLIEPRYTLIARDASGTPVGFVFAVRNLLRKDAFELVVKTLAVLPGAQGRGLGRYLIEEIHHRAAEDGCEMVYHAFMHTSNISAKITASEARECRRYRLYAKGLA